VARESKAIPYKRNPYLDAGLILKSESAVTETISDTQDREKAGMRIYVPGKGMVKMRSLISPSFKQTTL